MLKVEDTFFKIHRYFFERDSPLFSAMFSLPQKKSQDDENQTGFLDIFKVEGQADENPIILPEIQAQDFERLLSIMYPRQVPFSKTQRHMDAH